MRATVERNYVCTFVYILILSTVSEVLLYTYKLNWMLEILLRVYVCVWSASLQPHVLWPARLFCLWDPPGKNTGVGCHALLQGIFPIQGSNPGLPHCRRILYQLSHQGSPVIICWISFTWLHYLSISLESFFFLYSYNLKLFSLSTSHKAISMICIHSFFFFI